jgi:TonB family protein
MQILQRGSFLFAILLHFLLFSGISYTNVLTPPHPHEMPALDIPAYVAHEEEQSPSLLEQESQIKQKEVPTSPLGLEKPVSSKTYVLPKPSQFQEIKTGQSTEEPVHLIGDKKVSKSLIVLLGKAITAHLIYPKSAMDLNVGGTSYFGFTLYPDGRVSDIKLLKTSTADVLDKAAYNAISAISPVKHVDTYIQKPEFIVFGIIFG